MNYHNTSKSPEVRIDSNTGIRNTRSILQNSKYCLCSNLTFSRLRSRVTRFTKINFDGMKNK